MEKLFSDSLAKNKTPLQIDNFSCAQSGRNLKLRSLEQNQIS